MRRARDGGWPATEVAAGPTKWRQGAVVDPVVCLSSGKGRWLTQSLKDVVPDNRNINSSNNRNISNISSITVTTTTAEAVLCNETEVAMAQTE